MNYHDDSNLKPNERTKATKTDYLSKTKHLINSVSHDGSEESSSVVLQNEKEYDDTIGDDDL